jgi:predicted dehydrogenase
VRSSPIDRKSPDMPPQKPPQRASAQWGSRGEYQVGHSVVGAMAQLRQAWQLPSQPRSIVFIGAGGVVRAAHLPAYQRLKFPIGGLFDVSLEAARETARLFGVKRVFASLVDATQNPEAIFDVAVPGDQIAGVLQQVPRGAAVLIQKPMGEDLDAARQILNICRDRGLIAAQNFQLRFSPNILALFDLLARKQLGQIVDIEVRLVVKQPWRLWTFLEGAPRLEILYHSIHYLDTIRAIAGDPRGVYCRAVANPATPELRDTRSTIILNYGDHLRCSLLLNHTHLQDATHRTSMLKVEGTRGAAQLTLGVNLDYPKGPPDTLEVALDDGKWHKIPLRGSWFTEAFEGPMSNLQRFVAGEDDALVSPVEDAIKTMALVEACYQSSASGGTPVPMV